VTLLGFSQVWAAAQDEAGVSITSPQTDAFPQISFFLDAHHAGGAFVHGLRVSDFRILEDGKSVPVKNIKELRPGVQLVVVFNPGQSFLVRNSQGTSRYDMIIEALVEWARSRLGSTIDDLSILVMDGPERTHISNPLELFYTLSTYDVATQTDAPTLDTLFRGVKIASDPIPRVGMERVVLFITAPIEGDLAFNLQNLISQSRQQNVHIYTWMVASPDAFKSDGTNNFLELANQTGGALYMLSGTERVPSLETYLEPLRSTYFIFYDSQIRTGGTHQLAAEIQHGDPLLQSQAVKFELKLQPPNPVFISPVLQIKRGPPSTEGQNAPFQPKGLVPTTQECQILVDFPDGRVRPIVHSTFYVDGAVAVENLSPPFDRFTWDLSSYTESNQHVIQAEVMDNLGLKGKTIETLVLVEVRRQPTSPLAFLARHIPLIAGAIVLLSAAVLVLVLIMGGKIRPGSPIPRQPGRRREPNSIVDPLTAPVRIESEVQRKRKQNWPERLQSSQRQVTPQASACLVRIAEAGDETTVAPIPITVNELTLGRNASLAVIVLDDPSVEALHARMVRGEDGTFRIMDEGSVAGTWVNYSPVSREGTSLEHGDLIHIGRVGFRFTLREPQHIRKPVVTFEKRLE
jgi:hypothetical protein